MKKKLLAAALVVAMVAGFAGCGDKKNPEENTQTSKEQEVASPRINLKEVDVDSIVTLGEYKGLKLKVSDVTVEDESVEELFQEFYVGSFNPELGVKDRPAVEGDTVNIDYVGKLNGEAFQGGTDTGSNLTLGSHQFIDGFEDGLIGVTPGQTVDLNLTFPENYGNELAGQQVVFTVTVNYIIPAEPMDAAIPDMGINGVNTVEELRQFIYDYLYDQAMYEELTAAQDRVVVEFVESCKFTDIPEGLIAQYRSMTAQSLAQTAANYSMDAATFVQYFYGLELDAFLDRYAEETAKEYIAMQALANKEGLTVSDEELQSMLEEYATSSGAASVEEYLGTADKEDFREYFVIDNAVKFIMSNLAEDDNAETSDAEAVNGDAEVEAPVDGEQAESTDVQKPENSSEESSEAAEEAAE